MNNLGGGRLKKTGSSTRSRGFSAGVFFLFRSLSLFQLSFAPCPRADHASLLQLASAVDMFPILPVFLLLGASYKINWNLLILKHCRKSNSKVYMYLIRTACKTSKSYLEVNPFMIHNIPHENKPFIVGGIFDKHVQV